MSGDGRRSSRNSKLDDEKHVDKNRKTRSKVEEDKRSKSRADDDKHDDRKKTSSSSHQKETESAKPTASSSHRQSGESMIKTSQSSSSSSFRPKDSRSSPSCVPKTVVSKGSRSASRDDRSESPKTIGDRQSAKASHTNSTDTRSDKQLGSGSSKPSTSGSATPSSSTSTSVKPLSPTSAKPSSLTSAKPSISDSTKPSTSVKPSSSTSAKPSSLTSTSGSSKPPTSDSTNPSASGSTDIRSDDFDPLAALYSDGAGKCDGLVFHSFSQCESYFNRKEKRDNKKEAGEKPETSASEKDELLRPGEGRMAPIVALPERRMSAILKDPTASATAPSRLRKSTRNVLTRMDEVEEGPLSILRRAVKEGIRIRVWTRSHVYIRGICSGFLVAYDKHVNLAMTDVDEEFLIPKSTRDKEHDRMRKSKRRRRLREEAEKEEKKKGEEEGEEEESDMELGESENANEGNDAPEMGSWQVNSVQQIPSTQGKRTFKLGQVQKRHIGQLFIKGDNVVLVSLAVT